VFFTEEEETEFSVFMGQEERPIEDAQEHSHPGQKREHLLGTIRQGP
jgi:hypothetical protein